MPTPSVTTRQTRRRQPVAPSRDRVNRALDTEGERARLRFSQLILKFAHPLKSGLLRRLIEEGVVQSQRRFEKCYIAQLAGNLTGARSSHMRDIGLAAELAMDAAIVVDDWTDRSDFRMGAPAIHAKHGPTQAVLFGNCLMELAHRALDHAANAQPPTVGQHLRARFQEAVVSIQVGQSKMAAWAGRKQPGPQVVDELADDRSGRLVAFIFASAALLGKQNSAAKEVEKAGLLLGRALQLRNDIQDFTVAYRQSTKPPLNDLLQGQPNLVLSYLYQRASAFNKDERATLHGLYGSAKARVTERQFADVLQVVIKQEAAQRAGEHFLSNLERAEEILCRRLKPRRSQALHDYFSLLKTP